MVKQFQVCYCRSCQTTSRGSVCVCVCGAFISNTQFGISGDIPLCFFRKVFSGKLQGRDCWHQEQWSLRALLWGSPVCTPRLRWFQSHEQSPWVPVWSYPFYHDFTFSLPQPPPPPPSGLSPLLSSGRSESGRQEDRQEGGQREGSSASGQALCVGHQSRRFCTWFS